MPYRLRNLKVDRVDLVDQGANQHAHVVLFKRHTTKGNPDVSAVHVDQPTADEDRHRKLLSAAKAALESSTTDSGVAPMTRTNRTKRFVSQIIKAAKTLLKSEATEGQGDATGAAHLEKLQSMHAELGKAIDQCGDVAKLPADHPVHAMKATHEALGKAIEAHKAAMDATAKAAEEGTADGDPEDGDEGADGDEYDEGEDGDASPTAKRLQKRFAQVEKDLRAEITKANDRAKAAEEVAKAERDRRETDEIAGVLKSFSGMSIDVAKHTPLFKSLRATNPELYTSVIATLTGANAAVAKGGLFGEHGSNRDGAVKGGAWDQICAKADEMVSKSSKPMTREQAIDEVMKRNPRLVREYRNQQQ